MLSVVPSQVKADMAVTREAVLDVLGNIIDPVSNKDIVTAGLVRALTINGDAIRFVLEIDPARAKMMEAIQAQAKADLEALDGTSEVSIVMTAHSAAPAPPDLNGGKKSEPSGPQKIPGIDRIIAVASGKGGGGKTNIYVP